MSTMDNNDPPTPDQFNVAIFCALGEEAAKVRKVLDEEWQTNQILDGPQDKNMYTFGRIGDYLIVVVWIGGTGKVSANEAAMYAKPLFPKLEYVFVVGICGGLPHAKSGPKKTPKEIILGDVIISTAIQKYDEGKRGEAQYFGGVKFEPKGRAEQFLKKIKDDEEDRAQLRKDCVKHLTMFFPAEKYKSTQYPGAEEDKLFQRTYIHKHHSGCEVCKTKVCQEAIEADCEILECDENFLTERTRIKAIKATGVKPDPEIFFDFVGSGDTVMKSATFRDEYAEYERIIAFEMEGAGVCRQFESTIVIKGVCDYADTHKNKLWQPYAAATAAACVRAYLELQAANIPVAVRWKKSVHRLEELAQSVSPLPYPTFVIVVTNLRRKWQRGGQN